MLQVPSLVKGETVARARYLMGTVCEIEAHGSNRKKVMEGMEAAFEEIARLEQIMSTFIPDSEVNRLKSDWRSRPPICSPELSEVLMIAEQARRATGGAFDVTLGKADGRVDLGGIGKGYALDQAAKKVMRPGVVGARFNFGGQVLVVGRPPQGQAWVIQLASPDGGFLERQLQAGSVATSSNDERPHVIDPRTGKPAKFRGSVTVMAATGAWADALSTALLVMGEEEGRRWALEHPEVEIIFQRREQK